MTALAHPNGTSDLAATRTGYLPNGRGCRGLGILPTSPTPVHVLDASTVRMIARSFLFDRRPVGHGEYGVGRLRDV